MSPTAILLLAGQFTLGLDLSQAYNTAVFTGNATLDCPGVPHPPGQEVYCPEPAFVNQLRPSASARLLYDRSGYYLEFEGDYTFYAFDPTNSELASNADLRGRWELGDTTVFEATELVGYGSSNTIRQIDVMAEGSMGLAAARSRFLTNVGRLALTTELGNTTDLGIVANYTFRRTMDDPNTDIPLFNYDGFEPRLQVVLERDLNEDNAVGIRLEYGQAFRPLAAAGPMFQGDSIYEASGVLTYRHRFNEMLAAGLEAGGVLAGPARTATEEERAAAQPTRDPELVTMEAPTGTYVGPAAGANLVYTGSVLQSRARYTYGFGGNGVAASSAAYHEIGVEAEILPDPLHPRLTFYGSAEGYLAREVLADSATRHRTLEANAGGRYYLTEWLRIYLNYAWRFQTIDDTPHGELDRTFKRHVVTLGLVGEYAVPRHMNAGQDADENESSEWWGDVDTEEEAEARARATERRSRERDEELGIDEDEGSSSGGSGSGDTGDSSGAGVP